MKENLSVWSRVPSAILGDRHSFGRQRSSSGHLLVQRVQTNPSRNSSYLGLPLSLFTWSELCHTRRRHGILAHLLSDRSIGEKKRHFFTFKMQKKFILEKNTEKKKAWNAITHSDIKRSWHQKGFPCTILGLVYVPPLQRPSLRGPVGSRNGLFLRKTIIQLQKLKNGSNHPMFNSFPSRFTA